MKLGAAKQKAPSAWRLIKIEVDKQQAAFSYRLNRAKLRTARRREGRYLLRTNLTESDPAKLWSLYLQLVTVEEAFKNLKGDLAIRPIFHQNEQRIEAHIFVSFLAYCLHVTLGQRLHTLAPGLTPRSVLEKFAAMQMIDVHLPTTDGRKIILTRYTHPEPRTKAPAGQTQATTTGTTAAQNHRCSSHVSHCSVVQTFRTCLLIFQLLITLEPRESAKSG